MFTCKNQFFKLARNLENYVLSRIRKAFFHSTFSFEIIGHYWGQKFSSCTFSTISKEIFFFMRLFKYNYHNLPYFLIWLIIISMTMKVPVLPIPALQCTIIGPVLSKASWRTFTSYRKFKTQPGSEGTPWSGHAWNRKMLTFIRNEQRCWPSRPVVEIEVYFGGSRLYFYIKFEYNSKAGGGGVVR